MGAYLSRRFVAMIVQIVLVAVAVFLLIRLVPGDPARAILGENAGEDQIATVRERLGLNQPLPVQFAEWSGNLLRGDLGTSIISGRPVGADILQRIGPSLEIILASLIISTAIAIPLGAIAAMRANRPTDFLLSSFAIVGLSLPGYVVGTLLVLTFGLLWRILPQTRYVTFAENPVQHLQLLILPVVTLALGNTAVILRMMRSSMLETVRQDYVRTARAKGLTNPTVIREHALRNAINPVISVIGLEVSTLLGGTVIIEQIFNWPGLSSLLMSGVLSRDYPVVQGVVLVIAILTIVINLLVDIMYGVLDPRIRLA